ncbi:MAG: UDP-N-acetylmuramoyl-tripeptide--D-alanyl-D-alanine ligase [Candidatus Goldiibacteriota bacterium]
MELTVKEIYEFFSKVYKGKNSRVKGISIDTRSLVKGSVFFALKGESTDGHKFIKNAVKKKAAVIINEMYDAPGMLKVKDTKKALLELAGYYYSKFPELKTAAITGSNGKTTTKEILAAIMAEKYYVHKNIRSYNNHTGLPLTIFGLRRKHQVFVAEIGMNRKGEIARLVRIIKPDTAAITNVGRAHAGFFRGVKGIAAAKAEIISGIKKNGAVVLNKDDRYYDYFAEKTAGRKIISFGIKKGIFRAKNIRREKSYTVFDICFKGRKKKIRTKLKGIHNVYNITAAAAAASVLGCGLNDAAEAMKKFSMKGSMRFDEKVSDGIRVINDSYNANPDSFRASVETIKDEGYKNIITVTGDMLELGKGSEKAHIEAGRMLASLNPKKVFIFGKYALYVKKGFLAETAGADNRDVRIFASKMKLKKILKNEMKKGDTLFLKASRANKLDEII